MNAGLSVLAVPTRILKTGENLARFALEHLPEGALRDGDVLAVTSKVASVAERRLVPRQGTTKEALIRREAERYLGQVGHGVHMTVKEGLLIPSAGIDESNSESGDYLLYPEDPFESARLLREGVLRERGLSRLGVILTDSRTSPLRHGVTGVALSWWGVRGSRSLVGEKDLFGRAFKMTAVNLVDSLAAAAVLMMGEGDESRPLAILRGAPAEFTDQPPDPNEARMPPERDLYFGLITGPSGTGSDSP